MNKFDIYKRCEDFTVRIIHLMESIPYRKSVGIIGDQLIRSSGSVGANLNEADNGRSKKEFVSCLGISLREANETIYWLSILKRTNQDFTNEITSILNEANIIVKILGKIYWSSKKQTNQT
ncbi:four helix bundle protein [Patescibacteria group bacterium]|nr:four helix bundle protein [Patescibacteria group bacterium]